MVAMGVAGVSECEREGGVVRFDRIVLVGLTTGSNQWAPPEGLVVICIQPKA
jgi:hypothetical protein